MRKCINIAKRIQLLMPIGAAVLMLLSSEVASAKVEREVKLAAKISLKSESGPIPLSKKATWLVRVDGGWLFYTENVPLSEIKRVKLDRVHSIFGERPMAYVLAVNLFVSRQYAAALTEFVKLKDKYSKMAKYDNSLPVQAAMYEMACYRKLKQYGKLKQAERDFTLRKFVTKQSELHQLNVYKMWALLEHKQYKEIVKQYEANWKTTKVTGDLRAQLEYLYGCGLVKRKRPTEALTAFSKAAVANTSRSEVISRLAIDAYFRVIEADKEVQDLRKLLLNPNNLIGRNFRNRLMGKIYSPVHFRLMGAGALVNVHDMLAISGYDGEHRIIALKPAYQKYRRFSGRKPFGH